ncbi:hypothetical protein Tco_0173688 [Tanacetum coccineum]
MLDSDFILSDDSLGSDLEVSFPSGTRNKIFDPGILFNVQSKRFLSQDTFSISSIRNPLFPMFDTLLPFSSKNEDKVFNLGILSSNLLSHRGKITSDFSKSPMMISRGDIPILDVSDIQKRTKTMAKWIKPSMPEDSLIIRVEHLSTIPEKESDEVIKSSVEDLVPISSESKDTSESDKNIESGDVDEIEFLLRCDRLPIPDGSLPLSM